MKEYQKYIIEAEELPSWVKDKSGPEKTGKSLLNDLRKKGDMFELMNAVAAGKVDPDEAAYTAEEIMSDKFSGGPRHGW